MEKEVKPQEAPAATTTAVPGKKTRKLTKSRPFLITKYWNEDGLRDVIAIAAKLEQAYNAGELIKKKSIVVTSERFVSQADWCVKNLLKQGKISGDPVRPPKVKRKMKSKAPAVATEEATSPPPSPKASEEEIVGTL